MSIKYFEMVRNGFKFVTGKTFMVLSALGEDYDPENNPCTITVDELRRRTRLSNIRKHLSVLNQTGIISLDPVPFSDEQRFHYKINFERS